MEKQIGGYKVNFSNWQGRRVYVKVNNKNYGTREIGYLDIASGEFVYPKNKGMYAWMRDNLELSEAALIEMCKQA